MGEVYKAEDLKLNQTVALKFLPEAFRRRHGGARKVLQRSPHGAPGLAPERLSRLRHRRGRRLALPLDGVYRRRRSVFAPAPHRPTAPTIKRLKSPDNSAPGCTPFIRWAFCTATSNPPTPSLTGAGRARITDFGIAGLESELKDGAGVAGTPAYMSPEQITGKELTAKSDIYSLGLVLYEIFTGRQAFEADSINELIRKHQNRRADHPFGIRQRHRPARRADDFSLSRKRPARAPCFGHAGGDDAAGRKSSGSGNRGGRNAQPGDGRRRAEERRAQARRRRRLFIVGRRSFRLHRFLFGQSKLSRMDSAR